MSDTMTRPAHVVALMEALPEVWIRQDGSFQWDTVVWRCGDPEPTSERYRPLQGGVRFRDSDASGEKPEFRLSQLKAIVAYIEAEVERARAEGRLST